MAYNNPGVVFEESHFPAQVEEKYSTINVHYPFIVFSLAQMNSNPNVMLLSSRLIKTKSKLDLFICYVKYELSSKL